MSDEPTRPLISVMLCCRDAAGNPAEEVVQITLGGGVLLAELEAGYPPMWRWCSAVERAGPCPGDTEKDAPHLLKLYGMGRYPAWRVRQHVGNVHWDEALVSVPVAARLLRDLRRMSWDLTAGPSALFYAWRDPGADILPRHLEGLEAT